MQLSAGREMDILVAEQVIGWQIETDQTKLKKLNWYISRSSEGIWWRTTEGGWQSDPPSFSSNIAAAWRIVEVMNSLGQTLFLLQSAEQTGAAFELDHTKSPDYISDKSVTAAICKAALIVTQQGSLATLPSLAHTTTGA
jgi:hypothetical protein